MYQQIMLHFYLSLIVVKHVYHIDF